MGTSSLGDSSQDLILSGVDISRKGVLLAEHGFILDEGVLAAAGPRNS